MSKLINNSLFLATSVAWLGTLVACSGGGSSASGPQQTLRPSGQSSVTLQGAGVSRTTQYGIEPNTSVYCNRYRNGHMGITLQEKGENRNNSGWLKDGLSFSFNGSVRPQDTTEIGTAHSNLFVVIKEMPGGGTFNLSYPNKCTLNAAASGDDLDMRFTCPRLERDSKSLTAYGWVKCKVVQQDF